MISKIGWRAHRSSVYRPYFSSFEVAEPSEKSYRFCQTSRPCRAGHRHAGFLGADEVLPHGGAEHSEQVPTAGAQMQLSLWLRHTPCGPGLPCKPPRAVPHPVLETQGSRGQKTLQGRRFLLEWLRHCPWSLCKETKREGSKLGAPWDAGSPGSHSVHFLI